ncbi:complement C1q-like protein 4 [Ruditapes philippinarum]|uniref:complement C1q-like protein 4 n=1 Tax=Ruditapes philippinarum TaxID=129788 RepID=UPI00295AB996|nr:complement C1q-like protein 4 [Ruditapes philippinarum]
MCGKTKLVVLVIVQIAMNGLCSAEGENLTYIAQVLDKVVRLEVKVKELEKDMKKTNADTKDVLENVNNVLDNKTAELELLQDRDYTPIIAFNAYSPVDMSLDTSQILILQTVRLNEGNGYDNVLGVFTAPVTGLYFFVAHICNYAGRGIHYDIMLEHNTIAKSTQFNNVQYDCSSTSAVTMVTKGQRAYVKCTSGNTSPQVQDDTLRQTSFSGFLLQRKFS